jgi:predicted metal-binding membrane protein
MTVVESIVRHERRVLMAAIVLVPVVCGAWVAIVARDMYGPMTGASAWMMTSMTSTTSAQDLRHTTMLAAMWIVMMAGMMTPSVSPALLIYAAVMRRYEGPRAALRVYPMAAGYLLVWTAFSIGAALLQRVLSVGILSPMMEVTTPWAAALLLVAAAYQMTPFKATCLDSCRSPIEFISSHMRSGASGAFQMGLRHGLLCVGCCWALMLLLFAGGVMNLWTIGALTLFVLVEKLSPFGARTARITAAGLAIIAVWILAL